MFFQIMLKHNYYAALATIAGFSFLMAYPVIIKRNRGIPSLYLYSQSSDTGKSTALYAAAAIHGQEDSVCKAIP